MAEVAPPPQQSRLLELASFVLDSSPVGLAGSEVGAATKAGRVDGEEGRLDEAILRFVRGLRAAGLALGPGAALDALSVAEMVGLDNRANFRAGLRAALVKRREHIEVFELAFDAFWTARPPALLSLPEAVPAFAQIVGLASPPGTVRLKDAFSGARRTGSTDGIEGNARIGASQAESLSRQDFAQMSAEEIAKAYTLIGRLRFADEQLATRRWIRDPRGQKLDIRLTMRNALRARETIALARKSRRLRHPPIVSLCDISGSMSDYSRIFLHFLHVLTHRRTTTQSFLFGTRLTNVTRALRARDVDDALARVAANAKDWSGGTRIADSLRSFNRDWSRRVLAQGAIVLLITDGLERDPGPDLQREMRRLQTSCRRLIWLNPLLRYQAFEAKAQGIRAMLPFVDEFRPIHDLKSLRDLCLALDADRTRQSSRPARLWLEHRGGDGAGRLA